MGIYLCLLLSCKSGTTFVLGCLLFPRFIFVVQLYKSIVITAYHAVVIVVDKAVCVITLDISIFIKDISIRIVPYNFVAILYITVFISHLGCNAA